MAIASRCSSRATWISGPYMSSVLSQPIAKGATAGVGAPSVPGARRIHVSAAEASALDLTLRALRPFLADPEVTELCINHPCEAFVETRDGWRHESLPFASFDWCRRLAKLVANSTRQRVDEES